MMTKFALVSLLLLGLIVGSEEAGVSTCTGDYAGQTPVHTMCLPDKANAVAGPPLTEADKTNIVNFHNKVRRAVPNASNMMELKWNDKLATVALKWAMQCNFSHDKNRREPDLDGHVGQNLAFSNESDKDMQWAMSAWAAELSVFNPNQWTEASGHYIQQVYHAVELIGCGQASCGIDKYFVCNYFQATSGPPFYATAGTCASCPGAKCDNGLCDCTSVGPCKNGGTRNFADCTCRCIQGISGSLCENMPCNPSGADLYPQCASQNRTHCIENYYLRAYCPYFCGLCKA